MRKCIFGILAAIMVLALASPAAHAGGVRIMLDGWPVAADAVNIEGRVLVGVYSLVGLMGGEVSWDAEATQATVIHGGNTVLLTIDSQAAYVNGDLLHMDVPPQIIADRTFLPLRFLAEALGLSIDWDGLASAVLLGTGRTYVTTFAGTGMHGSADGINAAFNMPAAVFGRAGELYVADTYNNMLRRVSGDGRVARISGSILAHDAYGFPHSFHRDGTLASALFGRPMSGVVDNAGRIFIADAANNAIRMIEAGNVYTFAGSTDAGFADGGMEAARFNHPSAIAIDGSGYIFVADTLNHAIRRVDTRGNVSTVAGIPGRYGHTDGAAGQATFDTPMGIAVCQSGVIYVADTGNHLIRRIENGEVTTLAGTLLYPQDIFYATWQDFAEAPLGGFSDGHNAMFNMPRGLALWNDMLLVADSANHRIRAVLPGGEVITVAGTGYPDFIDGAMHTAAFHLPKGLHIVGNTLFIADTGNNLIRTLTLDNGSVR